MSQLGKKLKLLTAGEGELLYLNGGDGGIQAGDILVRTENHLSAYPGHAPPSGWTTGWNIDAPSNWYNAVSSYRQEHYGAYRIADGTAQDSYAQHWWRWTGGPITSVSNLGGSNWTSHPGNITTHMANYETDNSIGIIYFEGMYLWGKTANRQSSVEPDNGYPTASDYQIVFGRKNGETISFTTSGGSASGPGAAYTWYYIGGYRILRLFA